MKESKINVVQHSDSIEVTTRFGQINIQMWCGTYDKVEVYDDKGRMIKYIYIDSEQVRYDD